TWRKIIIDMNITTTQYSSLETSIITPQLVFTDFERTPTFNEFHSRRLSDGTPIGTLRFLVGVVGELDQIWLWHGWDDLLRSACDFFMFTYQNNLFFHFLPFIVLYRKWLQVYFLSLQRRAQRQEIEFSLVPKVQLHMKLQTCPQTLYT
ncbi:hypothetical protein ACJX0J_027370, partial [Zea mays]